MTHFALPDGGMVHLRALHLARCLHLGPFFVIPNYAFRTLLRNAFKPGRVVGILRQSLVLHRPRLITAFWKQSSLWPE